MYTVAFQPEIDGFTSFFDFTPDVMVGLNNSMYSFYKGQIYKHYINPNRNTFYGNQPSSLFRISINDDPDQSKLFKTVSVNASGEIGTYGPGVNLATYFGAPDPSQTGFAQSFFLKEGELYSRIAVQTDDTSVIKYGVGELFSTNFVSPTYRYTVYNAGNPIVPTPGSTNIAYINGGGVLTFIGLVEGYTYNGNYYTYYTSSEASTPPLGSSIVLVNDSVLEVSGMRGNYMVMDAYFNGNDKSEIYSVSSDAFKSFP